MAISLKDINRAGLVLVVVANVAVYYVLLTPGFEVSEISNLLGDFESYVPAGLIALVVGVLNSQLGHEAKARIVFWRWNNPLPGSRAFSHIIRQDTRIDLTALQTAAGTLPTDPGEQNRLWFKWYREFQNEPGILQVHREYLFTRDWAGLAILLGLALVPLAFWQMERVQAWIMLTIIVVEYLLVRRSAKNHGERFVASVMANKSAGKSVLEK
jgi:hypothetical protein